MKAFLYHLQLNVSDAAVSLPFYRELLEYFEYDIFDESDDHIGATNGTTDFWIMETAEAHKAKGYHRKAPGLNHLAFRVGSTEEVDAFVEEFLVPRGITPLYETPKVFPEYTTDYYAVFFEDPDRVKLEVVYLSD